MNEMLRSTLVIVALFISLVVAQGHPGGTPQEVATDAQGSTQRFIIPTGPPGKQPLVDYVSGCEDSEPRKTTVDCEDKGGVRITVRGRGFGPGGASVVLVDSTGGELPAKTTHSTLLPSLLLFFNLPAQPDPSVTHYDIVVKNSAGLKAKIEKAVQFIGPAKTSASLLSLNFTDFEALGIGGLDKQFKELFRRAFASRIDGLSELTDKMGMRHVKGVLLHGPPGTGKTLTARKIASLLDAKRVQLINGPEIMSKFIGQSEENLRGLFAPAEVDFKKHGAKAKLHVIIFDEIDAMMRHRGQGDDSAARAVYDGVTTQLLAYMDGLKTQSNVLVVGLTNRIDGIDKALLRPGRFEVQIRMHLPSEEGRSQIFTIHTKKLREHKLVDAAVDFGSLAKDTIGFSGADIEGVVRSAVSFGMQRLYDAGPEVSTENFRVTADDFKSGINDIIATRDASSNTAPFVENGVVAYNDDVAALIGRLRHFVELVKRSRSERMVRVALEGCTGCGTTAMAAAVARWTSFPFVHVVSPDALIGMTQGEKLDYIRRVFDTSSAEFACVVLDRLEQLVEFNPVGSRVNAVLLHEVALLLRRRPKDGSRVLVLVTSSSPEVVRMLGADAFDARETMLQLSKPDMLKLLLAYKLVKDAEQAVSVVAQLPATLPIKRFIFLIESAAFEAGLGGLPHPDADTVERFHMSPGEKDSSTGISNVLFRGVFERFKAVGQEEDQILLKGGRL